jgi:hypothetical protein
MTATVGGLWDALLSESRLFTVTSNSDNHRTVLDTARNGDFAPGQTFDTIGHLPDPVETGIPQPGSDFWPGQFSRTHVGVAGTATARSWPDSGPGGSGSTTASSSTASTSVWRPATAAPPCAGACGYAAVSGSVSP